MLQNNQIFSLINVGNVRSGLLASHLVRSALDFEKFSARSLGVPILVPADNTLFNFEQSDIFSLSPDDIARLVYNHEDTSYIGLLHAFSNFQFLANFEVKPNYRNFVDEIVENNKSVREYIASLHQSYNCVGAFQTRNIPHYGHEQIMRKMLEHCDHLVINPVLGPKKTGDVTQECLVEIFQNYFVEKYDGKISFFPISANMYYAGPREAVHHALIRKKLGFDLFSVGRDHAGAKNAYQPHEAIKLISQIESKLGIDIMCHQGAVFCEACDGFILRGDCRHCVSNFRDISGTEFRDCISGQRVFEMADLEMQKKLFASKVKIFEK